MRCFWIVLGLGLLLAACNTPVNQRPAETLRATAGMTINPASPVPTATLLPSPTPSLPPVIAQDCPNTPLTQLIIHERAQVTDNDERLNLRRNPGTDNPIIERIEPGEIVFVLDGPICTENYTWYQVRYEDETGWVAEGDFDEYFITPYLPG